MKAQKLPKTDSITELAKFWDSHDLTEFEDQLEEVREPVFERKSEVEMKIHLPRKEVEAVKRIAKTRGIKHTTMLREWILERIHFS